MLRPQTFVITALAVIIGFFFLQKYKVDGLGGLKIQPRTMPAPAESQTVHRAGETIRIASFNIQVFGEEKALNKDAMEVLARIVRNFDVIAIQEIRCKHQDLMPEFVQKINATGKNYDYAIGPRLGDTSVKEQYAFVFDSESVEINRSQIYTMEDPENWMHREPLVAQFRVRGPAKSEAFTFTLVNVHIDPDVVVKEINVLDNVYRAVRDDGLNEDDVILLGDFNVDDKHFGELADIPGMVCVINGQPTNTVLKAQYDNLVFNEMATTEFAGRQGVFNFTKEYGLSLEQALEVSDHLPVWAEFSIYEQTAQGRLASERGRGSRQ